MAIAYVNSATGTNSATFTSPVAGYVQVVFAFRDGSNTAPTIPTPPTGNAWTSVPTTGIGANTCASVMVYRVVASASDTGTGTFTNATSLVCAQYSGVDNTTPVGTNDSDTGASSTSINFNAVTFVGGSTSWAVGAMGHRQTDGTVTTAPSGMTNRTSVSDATDQAALHDTNGGVSGWSTTSASIGGTASGYRARVIELRAASGSYTMTAGTGAFTLTGVAAGLTAQRKLTAATGSFALTGVAAGLYAGRKLVADVGAFTLTGVAAGLLAVRKLVAEAGSFVLTGIDAALNKGVRMTASVGAFALTGQDAGLYVGRKLTCTTGSFTLTGIDADLVYASGPTNYTLTASCGVFTLTGIDASLVLYEIEAPEPDVFFVIPDTADVDFAIPSVTSPTLAISDVESPTYQVSGSTEASGRIPGDSSALIILREVASLNFQIED